MANLNEIQCATLFPNTGQGLCGYVPAPISWIVFIPKGEVITAANAADIKAYIQGKLINNSRAARWFVFGQVAEPTDNGQDVARETLPSGAELITRERTAVWKYDFVGGTFCVQKNLLQFDNTSNLYDVLFVDANFVIRGQQTTDGTGAFAIGGYNPYNIYVHAATEQTFDATVRYSFELKFLSPKQDQATMAVIDLKNPTTPVNWNTVFQTYSVQNVSESNVTPGAAGSGVYHVAFLAACGNDNMATRFQTGMAASANYVVTNATTGGAITVTSVALNATKTAVIFTMDTADPDYPASGGKISIILNTISTLAAYTQPMKYYESLPFTVTVP
jgi:hypothetical protein